MSLGMVFMVDVGGLDTVGVAIQSLLDAAGKESTVYKVVGARNQWLLG